MLRLPPTAISIVASEVRAYEDRRQARRHFFKLHNDTESLFESKSQDPERKPLSPTADAKISGSETSSFHDALTTSPDPSVLGFHGHDELAEALSNLAPGRNIIFESPSLPVRLKNTQSDGVDYPSEEPSLIVGPRPEIEDPDAQPVTNEFSGPRQIEMGLRTQRPSRHSSRRISLDMTHPNPTSPATSSRSSSSLPRVSWMTTRALQRQSIGASPATVSSPSDYGVRMPPETPPRRSSLQAGSQERLLSGGTSELSVNHRLRSPIIALRSPGSSGPAALRTSRIIGASSASQSMVATPSLSSSLQLDGSHDFQIYNDGIPAAEQPQTPYNLPEARYHGRLRGPFTAPINRVGMAQSSAAVAARDTGATGTPTTANRGERDQRGSSPLGLNTPGFRGLYGGLENTDDAALYVAGSRMASGDSRYLEVEGDPEERS